MTQGDPFADVRPETPLRAARDEDHERIARMLATHPSGWSDEDIDIVMSRAQTTIGGPETFKWILPAFLERSVENPAHGWMTISAVLADKLDRARFDNWPPDQRKAALALLSDWLDAQSRPHDCTYDPEDDAELSAWLKARTA